jgi:hypothetical protein
MAKRRSANFEAISLPEINARRKARQIGGLFQLPLTANSRPIEGGGYHTTNCFSANHYNWKQMLSNGLAGSFIFEECVC